MDVVETDPCGCGSVGQGLGFGDEQTGLIKPGWWPCDLSIFTKSGAECL